MIGPRLKTLVIENLRCLRGKVVIPLDAQVVLVHATNGMGKTSVLSALELCLTGKIAHLATNGDGYRAYLTTLGTEGGSIELRTTSPYKEGARIDGSLNFSDVLFDPRPLLDATDSKFFAERCYLPQTTLSRLLEIYDDQRTSTTSPLTQFVKELLGLDPLDALVDGLYPAYNVTRVRNLVPEYRRLESLRTSLRDEIARNDQLIETATRSSLDRLGALNLILTRIPTATPIEGGAKTQLDKLRRELETRDEERILTDLSRTRAELRAVAERWRLLPAEDSSRDRASKQQREQAAAEALGAWRDSAGKELDEIVTTLRATFSDLPTIDDDPEESRAIAMRRAEVEAMRCTTLVNNSTAAAERVESLNIIIQRANTRIAELNVALAAGAGDAKSLASALAGVAPHVSGETCPLCGRDFSEVDAGPLAAHIAAKIASLTSEAGRLQSLANERAEESNRVSVARRDLLSAGSGQLTAEDQAELTVRAAQMTSAAQRLKALAGAANTGRILMAEAAAAREEVSLARRRDEQMSSILPEIDSIVTSLIGRQTSSFDSIDDALREADRALGSTIEAAESAVSLRIRALSEVELHTKDLENIEALEAAKEPLIYRHFGGF